MKLDAKQLRDLEEGAHVVPPKQFPVYLILDNIYDTYNIGGLFRLSDALAIEKLFICGESEIPPNHRIKKASIGTYKVVEWEYKSHALEAITHLRSTINSISIVSIEQHRRAVEYTSHSYSSPVAFVVGNETEGVSSDVLSTSDAIVSIPMWGINKSLNVIVSASIVLYHVYSTHILP